MFCFFKNNFATTQESPFIFLSQQSSPYFLIFVCYATEIYPYNLTDFQRSYQWKHTASLRFLSLRVFFWHSPNLLCVCSSSSLSISEYVTFVGAWDSGPLLVMHRGYSWHYAQELLLLLLEDPYVVPGMELHRRQAPYSSKLLQPPKHKASISQLCDFFSSENGFIFWYIIWDLQWTCFLIKQ